MLVISIALAGSEPDAEVLKLAIEETCRRQGIEAYVTAQMVYVPLPTPKEES